MEPRKQLTLSQHSGLMQRVMRMEEFRFLPSTQVWQRLATVTPKQMSYICYLVDFPTTPENRAEGEKTIKRILGSIKN